MTNQTLNNQLRSSEEFAAQLNVQLTESKQQLSYKTSELTALFTEIATKTDELTAKDTELQTITQEKQLLRNQLREREVKQILDTILDDAVIAALKKRERILNERVLPTFTFLL